MKPDKNESPRQLLGEWKRAHQIIYEAILKEMVDLKITDSSKYPGGGITIELLLQNKYIPNGLKNYSTIRRTLNFLCEKNIMWRLPTTRTGSKKSVYRIMPAPKTEKEIMEYVRKETRIDGYSPIDSIYTHAHAKTENDILDLAKRNIKGMDGLERSVNQAMKVISNLDKIK